MADKDDDDLFDSVSAMADRIGLSGREKSRYIHEHMTRGGYRAVPSYVRDEGEDDDDDDGSSTFFGGRRRRPTRDQESGGHGSGTRRRRSNDDEDWYS
jgi:hypothetical protein